MPKEIINQRAYGIFYGVDINVLRILEILPLVRSEIADFGVLLNGVSYDPVAGGLRYPILWDTSWGDFTPEDYP